MVKSRKNNRLNNILLDIPSNIDSRGEAIKVMTVPKAGWPTRDVIAISTEPGVVRGNHYHKKKEEIFVVISGKMSVSLVDVKTGEKKKIILDDKHKKMLFIHPYVAHAIKNIGRKSSWFVEVQNTDYDKNDDYKFGF